MRELGVRRIIGPCASGSLSPDLPPGAFVVCDQFVDRTSGRADTFYDGPLTTHVSSAATQLKIGRQTVTILPTNERTIQLLETTHFGRLGFVEIGALTVGRIVQQHDLKKPFHRGDEKSCFRFGGSAVALFGEPGKWIPSNDLLQRTAAGVETLVRLGEVIAYRPSSQPAGKSEPTSQDPPMRKRR